MLSNAQPRFSSIACNNVLGAAGSHRMAWTEWGDAHNPRVLICVHGLTRQGRDFDTLAQALADHYRVVCVDVAGRGRSDWLADPQAYAVPQYASDLLTLLGQLRSEGAQAVDWVGTSMGGLIGMAVAAQPQAGIRRLVLNDVGPVIEPTAVARIANYVGQPAHWPTLAAAADALWAISQGFGPHTREQWLALTRPQLVADGAGYKPHYDPAIGAAFRGVTPELAAAGEALLWHLYDAITCPTLLLRGALSDLLSPATAQAMTQRGPRAQLHEVAGVGHAPMLVQPDQVAVVSTFLRSP